MMMTDFNAPCELILKIGCNEYDEISTAIHSLLRTCSISDEKCFSIERQIQPTTYFGSFTTQSSISKLPVQCQSLSCVILLTDPLFQKQEFFSSKTLWHFHHKIELINEYQQALARQDYYELSQFLPLWSVASLPYSEQMIIRFNIFTTNFDLMSEFYQHLFQRPPDSRKSGFVLYNLSLNNHFLYQFSIKYSPAIQSYSISQSAYLKFRLKNLNHFIQDYAFKLFTINQFEYYIYDPDGNLLHLYVHHFSSKSLIYPNDSGFGESNSDPSVQCCSSNIYSSIKTDIDDRSSSSNDSGQCTSISSNECHAISLKNRISVRSAEKSEIDYRLKHCKPSLYHSEPRLMNSIQNFRPHFQSSLFKNWNNNNDEDSSYEVDSPSISSSGYLNAFLQKKQQQQSLQTQKVQQLIAQFEQTNTKPFVLRPKSALSIDQSKSHKTLLQQVKLNESPRHRSKSVTFERQNPLDQTRNPRINIGITLDSRLRKTPVFDMLRSTTMPSNTLEPQRLNRTYSLRHSSTPIARF